MTVFFQKRTVKYLSVFLAAVCLVGLLCGCEFVDNVTHLASGKTQENTELIDDFIHGENVDVNVKFDTPSASDVISGEYDPSSKSGTSGNVYYDEKSGQYVSKNQFNINSFIDNLKTFWIPLCMITFFIGFMIRRLNHSSATLRKFGLFLEIIFPVLFTLFVYIACALADSSMVSFFDNLF